MQKLGPTEQILKWGFNKRILKETAILAGPNLKFSENDVVYSECPAEWLYTEVTQFSVQHA